jgi:hypothetical protein
MVGIKRVKIPTVPISGGLTEFSKVLAWKAMDSPLKAAQERSLYPPPFRMPA